MPAITVIYDGGWRKRAYKYTYMYDALGGVAIIIGAVTNKLLHIGVRHESWYIIMHPSCSKGDAWQRLSMLKELN